MRFLIPLTFAALLAAQDRGFISVTTYTAEQDKKILKLYEGLRVADVSDGLDMVGLQDVGSSIRTFARSGATPRT
jgi:hypothetical protein